MLNFCFVVELPSLQRGELTDQQPDTVTGYFCSSEEKEKAVKK